MGEKRVGIIVGGGPAPGINAVIGSATIEAINHGFEVVGFYDGFQWLSSDKFDVEHHSTNLNIAAVARIHFEGGSVLRTSRASLIDPTSISKDLPVQPNDTKVQQVVSNLAKVGISHLITIGGDDTALSARFVSNAAGGSFRSVHVPKTIDNDLPLPHDALTFGFSTARYNGTHIVKNLMQDSKTTGRWYIVTVMGRSAGWLAMSVGQSASATTTIIPEEFPDNTTLHEIADIIEGSMLKRRAHGRPDGVAIVAEGLTYKLGDRAEIESMLGHEISVDGAGHMRLADVPLGFLLRKEIERRFTQRGDKITIVTHMLGYELRSADPTPGDMSYCRNLGHGCIRLLLSEDISTNRGVMVSFINGNLNPIPFESMADPKTNRVRVRTVNTNSDQYRVARSYMIRLDEDDFDTPAKLQALADEARMPPAEFSDRYRSSIS